MYLCTHWKTRPLSPEQASRMMEVWGKLEASQAENTNIERLCWYIYGDGSGGLTINKVTDIEAGNAWGLEASVALGEFLEMDSKVVLDLDQAMPAIVKGFELSSG